MKKSIFLFFAAILCAMSISAANMKGGEVLYLKPNSNWTQSNAWFAIYLCNGTSGEKWVKMTKSGDYYMATVPTGDYKNVIFCRMNNANTTKLDWSNKWNQSGDLSFNQKNNLCTIKSGQWDCGSNVTWTTYQPVSNASLATSAANLFVGAQATLTPSLSSNANVNTIKSTSYSVSPATGSVTNDKFTATAAGEYTVTATVTYYPNGCTSLTSGLKTATATATITVEVPAEETHDVTVSYICGETKLQDPTTVNTVGVETSVKVTAPEIARYTFANWDLGADVVTTDALTSNEINITTEAGGSDFTLVANYEKAKLTYTVTVPAGTENCYLVGAMNGWDVDNPIEMTKQGENVFTTTLEGVATTDEYKYLSKKGSWDYADVQESNRTWTANDVVTAWKDPLATNVHLAGTMTDWDNNKIEFKKATKEATTASIILNLTAGDYKFKIVDNGSWLGNNATIDKTISGWTFASDKGDCPLKATIAGDYTFTWAISTKKLSVTYPTICAITATANDAAMGTIAGAGDYGKGSTATLTATPNDGYLFVNWTKDGVEVATTQEYSFKVTEAVELVANFEAAPEEVHNVTVSYVCGGNKIADDQTVAAVGETSAKTVEAPAIFGYTFSSWTLGAGVTSTDATANPISINIVAGASDFTLTANYTEIPKVKIYVVNNKKWSKVNVYGWKDGEAQGTPAWPGQDITANKETEKIADFDVYSYSVVPGSYDNIIFNNNSGTQTETFKWTDGKYYYVGAAENYVGGTAEEVATALGAIVSYDYYIYGNMNDWKEDANYGMTDENEDGIYEKTLTFKNNAEFKVKGTAWYGSEAVDGTYKEVSDNGGNIKLSLGADTEVTVMFNSNTKKISFEGLTIDGDVVTYSYYIADDGSLSGNSNWSSKSIGLTDDNSDGIYEKTFTNQAIGTYLMKVTNGTWDDGYVWGFSDVEGAYKEVAAAASDNNIEIKLTAATTFTVKFNSNTKKISLDGLTPLIKQNLKYTVTVPKGTTKCYLVGLGDWNNFREMTQDPGNNRIFTLTVNDVYITDEYKYSASKNWDNAEVDVNNNDAGNRTWSESDVVVKWKNIDLLPEALTYTVTVPAGTEECYIAGTMNGWAFTAMEKSTTTPNTFTITIDNANEAHEYKYACKKNWDYAEVKADGSSVDNRTWKENDVVEKWGYPTYTVAGDSRIVFGEEWKETLTDNDMVDQGNGTFKWTKEKIALKKNTEIKFQVVKNHSWDNKWPNDPWVINTISKDGYYTITIIFKESDQSITATATWTGEAPFKDFSNQPATLYFHPSFHWTSDNAEFAAYFYNEGFGADAEPKWADMTDSDGDGVYEVANAKQHEYVIICRMNPSRTENKWDDAVSWNKIETGITIPNTAGDLNTCIAFWTNCQGNVPTSECTWVVPTPLTDANWSTFVSAYAGAGKTINAVVERSFKSGQNHTLCLPFDLPTNWLGEGAKAYQLSSIVSNSAAELELMATECATLYAGKPYIVVPVKGPEYEHLIVSGVTIQNATAGTNTITGGGYKATFKAVITTGGKTDGSKEFYIGANDGYLYNAQVDKLGLRAIIELTTTTGEAVKVRARVVTHENTTTGFENITAPEGQAIKAIVNGQLVIIRGGEMYNVQGQKL